MIARFAAACCLTLLLLGAAASTAMAQARDYRIDPVHSRLLFSVEHLGFARAMGTLSAPRGWLRFDPADWSSARGEIDIDLASLDLGDADFNRRLARRDGFDSERYPRARWTIDRVEPIDDRHFRAIGRLAWRGGEYPLALDVRLNRLARHPLTLRRTAGFSATASVSRAALGLTAWKTMVGDTVELRVEVEARRGRREALPAATSPAAGTDPAASNKEESDAPTQ